VFGYIVEHSFRYLHLLSQTEPECNMCREEVPVLLDLDQGSWVVEHPHPFSRKWGRVNPYLGNVVDIGI
jgi:hypothetical protein